MAMREAAGVRQPWAFVSAAGTQVAVARRGAGASVLCLHAIGHGGRDFDALAERLPDNELLLIDWPGQGNSPADATGAGPTAGRYAEIAAGVLDAIGVSRAVVLGNSIGGAAAIELVAARPDLVRALTLCDPGGLAPVDTVARLVIGRMVAFFAAGARGASWFPSAFAVYYRFVLPAPAAAPQRRRIVAAGRETAGVLRDAWAGFLLPAADVRATLAALDVPILFAWSKSDRIVALSRSRDAIAQARRGTVQVFPGGHAAFLEAPDRFAAAFRAFLAGCR